MNKADRLNQILVDKLKNQGFIQSPEIEAAFLSVQRHLFLPNLPLEEVYQDEAIITKRLNGKSVSSSSQPAMMAIMLEQLNLQPGDQVLEIGAATGYNAALMAHIVGAKGQVITLDIDEDIVKNARRHLEIATAKQVEVICADGGFGYPDFAPYDRIILTVGAWDIAPAWQQQLKPSGRLVLPLTLIANNELSIAFDMVENNLVSVSSKKCGFIKMRGFFAEPQNNQLIEQTLTFHLKRQLIKAIVFLGLPLNMKLRLFSLINFGNSSLENLHIRVYPPDIDYQPSIRELVVTKYWNKLVLQW
jgi:protein-L-isoaspartate(D-aspartate) O-methyltransferase